MTRKPLLSDPECLLLFDTGISAECFMLPRLPAIEEDEYDFIDQALQRYRDRDYRHKDPWRSEQSSVKVWT